MHKGGRIAILSASFAFLCFFTLLWLYKSATHVKTKLRNVPSLDKILNYGSSWTSSDSVDSVAVQTQLGLEQIEADFPGDYKNPNNWFRQQSTPLLIQQEALLMHEELEFLKHFDFSVDEMQSRIQKIESLWNVYGTQRSWNDHILGLDNDVSNRMNLVRVSTRN